MREWMDIEDWMVLGPLAEEIAESKRKQERSEDEDDWDNDSDYDDRV